MRIRILALFAVFLSLLVSASGQIDRSEINGTVTDASGAVIQGATIVLTEESTGHSRTAVSGAKGTYVFPALPVGRFTIVVHMDGFTDARIADLDLNSGNTRTINAVLRAGTTQVVSVEADRGANLDKDNATLGGTVESVQIARLPLNGRNISTLELLAPGAIDTGTGQQASIHFVGQGIDDNNFRLDGVDASGIYRQAVKSALRLQFSTEAVADFKVDSAGYTADTGGSAGAQVSLISKRGTNQFHGAVFEYLRNSFFDAQGPFKAKNPQTFRLNQFGGNVGGPIWRGRTYFFANYEGFRQSLSGVPQIATVPTQAFRQRVLAAQPALAPWFNAYPIGTTPASDPNAALVTYNVPSPSQENSGVMRIDHRFNEHDSMYGRYNIDDGSSVSALNVFQGVTVNSRIQNFVLEELHILSPTLLNEFESGFNRNTYIQAQNTGLPYNISITGFTPAAENYSKAQIPQSFSLNDTLTKVIGQHTLKMGVDLRRVMINEGNSVDGTLTYVGASTPTGIDYTNLLNGRLDSILVTAALTTRGLRKNQYMGYFQDQWKMTSELTINMGLRYNFFAPFHEKNGNAVPFDIPMCGGYCTPGGDFNLPDYLNLDPRVGLAYSPNALKGSTVLRAGFGIYHGETQLGDEDSPAVNTEPSTKLTSSNTTVYTYPSALALIPTTGLATTPRSMLLKRPISYTTQWTASIQQSLGHETTATVTYLGVKGTHLFRRSYTNLINPATGTRPLPQYPSAIDTKINAGMSIFHALQFSMTRRYHNGIFVSGNYMWSHALDDNSVGAGEANSPQNVAIPSADYASSSNDVRHTLTSSIVYELPFGIGRRYMNTNRWADLAVGGWSIDNLLIGRAGLPIDVQISRASSALPDGNNASQRPNRVPGQPIYGTGGINGWLNPAAFSVPANGQWGNLGRNIATGPTLWQDDTAVEKAFRLTERNALTFRAEAFNLLNRSQYANPNSSFGTATFGKITSPVNSSGLVGTGTQRVFEFALRLNY